MSSSATQPDMPLSAGADTKHSSTYKEAEPVAMGWGRDVYASNWISADYDQHTAYGGQNKPEWQYASIAARYCRGPIDFVGKVFIDGKQAANWDYTFSPGEESHTFTLNPSLASGKAFTAVVHRGTLDAPESIVANLRAKTGQNHPPYRGNCWIEWINIDLGQGQTSIPSFAVEIGTHAPAIGVFAGGDAHPYGVNPFAALYALLVEDTAGRLDPSLVDPAHFGAQAVALESIGVSARSGALTYCHPTFASRTSLGDAINTILSHVDGFIYVADGKICVSWFPNQPVDASGLVEITEADLTAKPSGGGFGDWNKGPTSAVVVFKDFERDYENAPARYNAPANSENRLYSAATRKDRPFIHAADQAALMAAEYAVPNTSDDSGVNLTVMKSRAVNGAGAPLVPGDLINWDYGPHALDLVCRITARRLRIGSSSDVLTIVRERGAFPRPYAAPVDVRVLPTPDTPGIINVGDVRLWALPDGFGAARQVAALIDRTKRTIYRYDLHFSPSGASPWEIVLDGRFFSAKCVVAGGGIGAGTAVVRVTSTSVDFARFAAQSTVAQTDDTLLMLIADEVVSVGTITVVSAGVYDLSILRARQSTVAGAHGSGVVSWLFYRGELRAATHAEFYHVRDGSNVYNATIATKYFKLALSTIEEDGLAKPDDPGIALQLPDLGVNALLGYTVILTNEAHTVATDSAGTVVAGQLGAGGTAKTDVQVFRAGLALTPVAATPNSDQFSIALGTLTNATATKEDADTVRADTLTANTGTIEITVNVAGAFAVRKIFTVTKAVAGTAGAAGAPGATGATGATGLSGLDGSTTFYGVDASPPTALRIGDVWFVTDKAFEMRRATATGSASWVSALTGSAVFEIIGGTTYIKKAAIREIDAGVILAGNIDVALNLTSLGKFTAGSGYAAMVIEQNQVTFGDFTWKQYGSIGTELRAVNGYENAAMYSTTSGAVVIANNTLTGKAAVMFSDGTIRSNSVIQNTSSDDPRTSGAPLYSAGGAWVGGSLDVLAEAKAGNFLLSSTGKIGFTNYSNYFDEYYGINIHTQGSSWPVRIDGALVMGAVGYGSTFTAGNIYDGNGDKVITSRQTGYTGSGTLSLAELTAIVRAHGLCD